MDRVRRVVDLDHRRAECASADQESRGERSGRRRFPLPRGTRDERHSGGILRGSEQFGRARTVDDNPPRYLARALRLGQREYQFGRRGRAAPFERERAEGERRRFVASGPRFPPFVTEA